MNFEIRNVLESDIDNIYELVCKLENEKLNYIEFKDTFLSNLNDKNIFYLVAEFEGKVLGFISLHSQKLLHHCGNVGEIQEFFVDTNYRKNGIGKNLFLTLLNQTKSLNFKGIEVTSNKKRLDNIKMYESLGFKLSHNKFTISQF